MTPDKQAIIAQIATLMQSGKFPAEIVEMLHGAGIPRDQAKQLVFEAGSRAEPYAIPKRETGLPPRSLAGLAIVSVALIIAGVAWREQWSSSQPDAPAFDQAPPPEPSPVAPQPAAAPVPVPLAEVADPIWTSGADMAIPQPGENAYDVQSGVASYGIVQHERDPVADEGVADLALMNRAQALTKAAFANGFRRNGVRIGIGAEPRATRFDHICVLLSDARRGGVYCGTVVSMGSFLGTTVVTNDERELAYEDLVRVMPDGSRIYPIIERHDAALVRRREQAAKPLLTIEEARAIAEPIIADWLKANGYEDQDAVFFRRNEVTFGQSIHVEVEGLEKVGGISGTPLFVVGVDRLSREAELWLKHDCAEFVRLLREKDRAR
ncbi:MAG TPA: hypothetical protein VEL07_12710 [Planctomycetota bacterium]|nr:hypothetical protein [Planctomycetota bacterium]